MLDQKAQFHDFIDPDLWQRIQDTFARATRLEVRVIDGERRNLSRPSRLTRFCQLVEDSPRGRERCRESDLKSIAMCSEAGRCTTDACHAKILGFAVPVVLNGIHIATVTGGECVHEPLSETYVRDLARDLQIDEDELVRAAGELEVLPLSELQASGELISNFLRWISESETRKAQLQARMEQLRVLGRVGQTLHSYLDVGRTLESVVEAVVRVLNVTAACVLLVEEDDSMRIHAARGFSKETIEQTRFPIGTGLVGHVAATGEPAIVEDMQQDPRGAYQYIDERENLRSLIAVALRSPEGIAGVLAACRPEPHHFSNEDLTLLHTLAGQAAIAVENARLYQRVNWQVKQLSDANQALIQTQERLIDAERLAVIGRVSSGIAHEIKNPLTTIIATAATIRDRYMQLRTTQTIELADTIVDECRRLNSLIDDIRNYAKPKKYSMENQAVSDVIEEVVSFLRLDPSIKRYPIYRRFDARPSAFFDRDKMKQVLINLLRNAAEAIDKPDGQIEIAVELEDGYALLRIADNGTGIPRDQLDHIFEPFYTTKGTEGTGLGLDIVREIVSSHDGTIEVDSELGRGTTFTIRLPVTASRISTEM